MEVDRERLFRRLTGRRTCRSLRARVQRLHRAAAGAAAVRRPLPDAGPLPAAGRQRGDDRQAARGLRGADPPAGRVLPRRADCCARVDAEGDIDAITARLEAALAVQAARRALSSHLSRARSSAPSGWRRARRSRQPAQHRRDRLAVREPAQVALRREHLGRERERRGEPPCSRSPRRRAALAFLGARAAVLALHDARRRGRGARRRARRGSPAPSLSAAARAAVTSSALSAAAFAGAVRAIARDRLVGEHPAARQVAAHARAASRHAASARSRCCSARRQRLDRP